MENFSKKQPTAGTSATNGAHPNSPNGQPTSTFTGDVWNFMAATRNLAALQTVRAKFPDFDLADVQGADDTARLVWRLRCDFSAPEWDAEWIGKKTNVDGLVAGELQLLANDDAPEAARALEWLLDPKAPTYQGDQPATAVAFRLLEEWHQPPTPRARFVFVSAQDVKAQKPPAALIDGVLYVNSGAELCGGQATFKSFTALAMADAIASGADWHGRATKKVPVAYITGEGSAAIGQRIRALEIHTGRPCGVHFLLQAVQLHRPDEVDALIWAILLLPEKPGLIVVDTLARCFVGGDENSAKDAGLFVAGVDRIRAATGAAVLVLHHLSKNGDSRGSTAFAGAFDTIIEAKRENTTVTLRCLKQKDAPDFEPMTLARRVVELDMDGEDGRPLTSLVFEPTDAPEPADTPNAREKVMALLSDAPDGLTTPDWQRAALQNGVSQTSFYRLKKEASALWFQTPEGRNRAL